MKFCTLLFYFVISLSSVLNASDKDNDVYGCKTAKCFSLTEAYIKNPNRVKDLYALGQKNKNSCLVAAENDTKCGPTTMSRMECAARLTKVLSTELDQVEQAIQEIFRNEPTILRRFEASKKAWKQFCEAELELHCPSDPQWWGSEMSVSTNYILAYLYRDRLNMLTPILIQYP